MMEQKNKTQTMEIAQWKINNIIGRLIVSGSKSPIIREFTVNLLRDNGILPYPFSIEAVNEIYEFVNKNIDYVKDIRRIETLQTAEKTLEIKFGDCDDKVILSGSMLRCIGYDICLVNVDLTNQKSYDHIFLLVLVNDKWIPFDPTMNNGKLGAMVKNYYHAKIVYLY